MSGVLDTLRSLETAEEILDHFGIDYERRVVETCRLHILQRTHDYLAGTSLEGLDDATAFARVRAIIAQAYADFTTGDPLSERVFKVLREAADRPEDRPGAAFISLEEISGTQRRTS